VNAAQHVLRRPALLHLETRFNFQIASVSVSVSWKGHLQ
jgi:hypothetical protein